MEKQQNKIFANCSQTVRNHCEFRNVLATSFALRNSIAPVHCTFAKFASHRTLAKFRIAKFAMCWQPLRISQCQFRNANFAMPISQGQYTVHLSHIKHQNLSEISHCEIRKPLCEFRKPLCQIRKPLPNSQTTLPTSLALRNSHLQALSSSVINATDFQTW